MSITQRNLIKKLLFNYFEDVDVSKIETAIWNMCQKLNTDYEDGIEKIYSKFAYEKLGEFITSSKIKNDLLEDLDKVLWGWESSVYLSYKEKENSLAVDQITGPAVASGELKCKKPHCRSDKCSYFQIQTRGCDEPFTTYVICSECGDRYTFS
jgi:DNA-directed RNA polymerase subunit M/transcription elongation factor TFIIS